MKNPALVVPDVMPAVMALAKAADHGGVPATTIKLVHLRASQINGCSVCVDMHARELEELGEKNVKIFAVSAWRDTPFFSEAERAALALTEATTRIADRDDPVSDAIWEEAARHYDERALGSLVLNIALINFWNRINVPTRQLALGRKWTPADIAAAS
ncbi:MAG TPA: carboxymuconolactone decarboxylase family protein [Nannocystaceae bacterium]|nr:carboxymuconolactone decarboxylase family protein [Nannocystaceae bacterium]